MINISFLRWSFTLITTDRSANVASFTWSTMQGIPDSYKIDFVDVSKNLNYFYLEL